MTSLLYLKLMRMKSNKHYGGGLLLLLMIINNARGQEQYFSVQEEGPIGPERGVIPGSSIRDMFANKGVQSSNETYILFTRDERAHVFAINAKSKTLYAKKRIDREMLCSAAKTIQCIIDFFVVLVTTKERIQVRVTIIDINDSPPRWPMGSELLVDFVESSAGAKLDIPLAIDADVGTNAEIKYHFESNESPFKLIHDNNKLTLETNSQIDREERANYTLKIVASDNGIPPLSGTILLKIVITDINDNTPRFVNIDQLTRLQVREDKELGSRITRLEATDADEGVNGKLRFNFSKLDNVEQKLAQKYFKIHSEGDIEIIKKLDYDNLEPKYFVFEVQVEDCAPYPYGHSASTSVTVAVLDLNDESPRIQICFFPNGCAEDQPASILEDVQPGSNVAEILVTDPDLDGKDIIKCSIPALGKQHDSLNFELRERHDTSANMPKMFELKTLSRFDREQSPHARISIECKDFVGHISRRNVTIMIKDVNDNEPQFQTSRLTLYIEENQPNLPSTIYPAVHAVDADDGINQKIEYSIGKAFESQFQIDSTSGLIAAKQAFDREQQSRYLVQVIASDGGTPSLSSTATVTLIIQDRNDCIPQFDQAQSEMSVQENKPRNTRVGQIKAHDEDNELNARVVYRLVSSDSNDVASFHIESNTGVIKTRRVLDCEKKQVYYLQVEARDQGTPSLSSTTTVTILIEDVNDHAPIFVKPTREHSEFVIQSREPGQRITSVLAHDNDTDTSAITYSVVNNEAIGYLFALDSSGMLYVNKSVHNAQATEWRLKISACDQGKPKPQCSIFYPLKIRLSSSGEMTESESSKATAHKRPGNNSSIRTTDNEAIVVFLAIIFFILIIALVAIILMLRRKAVLMRKQRHQQEVLTIEDHDKQEAIVKDTLPPMYEQSHRVESEYLLSQLHSDTVKSTSTHPLPPNHIYTSTPRPNHHHQHHAQNQSGVMNTETLQRARSNCSVDYQMLDGITAITSFSNQKSFQRQQPNYTSPLTPLVAVHDQLNQSMHTYHEIRPVEVDAVDTLHHKSMGINSVSAAISTESCLDNNYDNTNESTNFSIKFGQTRRAAFSNTLHSLQYPPYNPYAEASFV